MFYFSVFILATRVAFPRNALLQPLPTFNINLAPMLHHKPDTELKLFSFFLFSHPRPSWRDGLSALFILSARFPFIFRREKDSSDASEQCKRALLNSSGQGTFRCREKGQVNCIRKNFSPPFPSSWTVSFSDSSFDPDRYFFIIIISHRQFSLEKKKSPRPFPA